MSCTSLSKVGTHLICTVIGPLVYWSGDSPIFYSLGLFFFVFSMIFIFRSSLTLWLNSFFRLLKEIECRTLIFFFCLFNLENGIIHSRVKQMFCYGSFPCMSLSAFSGLTHLPLFLDTLGTTLLLLQREILAYVAVSLSGICQLRQTLVPLLTKLCYYNIMPDT